MKHTYKSFEGFFLIGTYLFSFEYHLFNVIATSCMLMIYIRTEAMIVTVITETSGVIAVGVKKKPQTQVVGMVIQVAGGTTQQMIGVIIVGLQVQIRNR